MSTTAELRRYAPARRCPHCSGEGVCLPIPPDDPRDPMPPIGRCIDCGGRGQVCSRCSGRLGECDCSAIPPKCDDCGRLKVACNCEGD